VVEMDKKIIGKIEKIVGNKEKWENIREIQKAIKLMKKIKTKNELYYLIFNILIEQHKLLLKCDEPKTSKKYWITKGG
jgi:chaperonin cofactor prefoldin